MTVNIIAAMQGGVASLLFLARYIRLKGGNDAYLYGAATMLQIIVFGCTIAFT